MFPHRSERGYAAAAVETFPWPVMAGYPDIHRWMDQGQAVHAAWQLRDVWEGLLKFLATLAVADHFAAAPASDPRTRKLLKQLLKKDGLTNGTWATLLEVSLKDGPMPTSRLPQLGPLLFQSGKRQALFRLFQGDTDDQSHDDFISWRNRCFGHGVFRKDLQSYADDSRRWLSRLHKAFDLCRPLLESLALETDGPNGEILTWGEQSPLPFYHDHQPAATGPLLLPVRVRAPDSEALLLTPMLSVQLCAVCGQWTVFYLDKYDRDRHRAHFLDFVEGHGNDHKDLEPLRTWSTRIGAATEPASAPTPAPEERHEPDPERFRDFQHEFEPPAYLAQQVADFLRTHERGMLLLTGPGGVGKSWIAQGLDHAGMLPAALGRAIPLLNVSMHGPSIPRASDVRTALSENARRLKRWQVPAWPDSPEPHTCFSAWLTALMRANGLGELIIALDGLDDLPTDSDVPNLWPPAGALPPGCYVVLAARPQVRAAVERGLQRVRSMAHQFLELRIGPDEPEQRAVLRSYVAKRLARPRPDGRGPLPAAWADPLIDQAEGSFLHAFHYCRALHFGVYTDLTQLPSPAAYYPAFFEHLRGRLGDQLFKGHYARALAFLAVAREPVSLTHLEAWGLKRSDLAVILDDLADLLRSQREPWDAETLYSLGHDAIRQFLTKDAEWQPRLAEANRYLANLAVRRFGNDWAAVELSDPVERYLLFHLLDHATDPKLRDQLLGNTALADACDLHIGYLADSKSPFSLLVCEMALCLRMHQAAQLNTFGSHDALAEAYMNRGNAACDVGDFTSAVDDYSSSIGLYRTLMGRNECGGSTTAFLPMAYMNRAVAYRYLGRLAEAAEDHSVAIDLYTSLAQAGHAPDVRPGLALAYMNRGVVFADLDRYEEALGDFSASIALFHDLVHHDGRLFLRRDLAMATMNRGVAHRRLDQIEQAWTNHDAAITLYQELVCRQGLRELRDEQASALLNRGNASADLGQLQAAQCDYDTAIRLYEELVNQEGRKEILGELARGYAVKADFLLRMGQRDNACNQSRDAVRILQSELKRTGRNDLRGALALAESVARNACGAANQPAAGEGSGSTAPNA